jgi:hypothetical protein
VRHIPATSKGWILIISYLIRPLVVLWFTGSVRLPWSASCYAGLGGRGFWTQMLTFISAVS